MNVDPISNNQTFEGKVIKNSHLMKEQRALFNESKPTLEGMIKDLPFDLLITQNKKTKRVSMTTNVEGAKSFIVRKGKHFVEAAFAAIEDAKSNPNFLYKMSVNPEKIFEYKKAIISNILGMDFKKAREAEKTLAKIGIENFEAFKSVPIISFKKASSIEKQMFFVARMHYKIYRAFTKKTPEEKRFAQMQKEYLKALKSQNKEIKTTYVDFFK